MTTNIRADVIIVPIITIPISTSGLISYPMIPQELYKIKDGNSIIIVLQIKLTLNFN